MTGQSDYLLRPPTSMLDRMATQAVNNQLIIQIGDLAKAAETLEPIDKRWNQVVRYLASALATAEAINRPPSIESLDALLAENDDRPIRILPDGSIEEIEQ